MNFCDLDHITVTAPDLVSGAAYVHQLLGVQALPGGEHPRMGTHNMFVRLGPELFLEIIAINPHADKPERPRWFALDELTAASQPRLSNWVARTDDIAAAHARSPEALGEIEAMSRGANHWLITIPKDGSLPLQGVAPALIEWHTERHPAAGMPELGVSLLRLELHHPDAARITRLLQALNLRGDVEVKAIAEGQPAQLLAYLQTPAGIRVLS